jgi:hypothetical protein
VHDLNARLLLGEEVDTLAHSQAISTMVRIASRIGTQRVARDVTPPSVQEYLAHKAKQLNRRRSMARRKTLCDVREDADEPCWRREQLIGEWIVQEWALWRQETGQTSNVLVDGFRKRLHELVDANLAIDDAAMRVGAVARKPVLTLIDGSISPTP